MNLRLLAFVLACCFFVRAGLARGSLPDPGDTAQKAIAEIQRLVAETVVETKGLPEESTLVEFLANVEARFLKPKKIALRLDVNAFGKELAKVAAAKVKRPPQKSVTLQALLRFAISRAEAPFAELDYAVRPNAVVITLPELAAHWMAYDVRDVIEHLPRLVPELRQMLPGAFSDLKAKDGESLLVRCAANSVSFRPWESIKTQNGASLLVFASPARQQELVYLLATMRRFADVAVVMNARLYEVDREFFTEHVAPLLAVDGRPTLIRLDGSVMQKIMREKLHLESDDTRIYPGRQGTFLSQHSAVQYVSASGLDKDDRPGPANNRATGTTLAGVSFSVRPIVSADRRHLRLHISQTAAQLVGIAKTKTLDVVTGKKIDLELPNIRKTSRSGTIDIPDGAPILMPVEYRPTGKGNEQKVWLLVARPIVWIEEEVQLIRKEGGNVSAKTVWDSEVPTEEKPTPIAPSARLPFNNAVKQILQAIVSDVLTNPTLKSEREFYGTFKDRTFALDDSGKLAWPKEFVPETHGFKLVSVHRDPFANQRRILGIRLDELDLKEQKTGPFSAPIHVCVFNVGGSANGGVIGGCTIYYAPKRTAKGWTVEFCGSIDP